MIKKISSLIIILFLTQSCLIGSGKNSQIISIKADHFPRILGINLEGKELKLPETFNKKLNLVIVAFKREQQKDVNSWINATKPIIAKKTEFSFFEIPVIFELSAPKRFWLNNAMRFGIKDKISRQNTITIYTNRKKFYKVTNMKEDFIYALLINNDGKILWRKKGLANKSNIRELLEFTKKIN